MNASHIFDVNDRRGLYPLSGGIQLASTAKLVPSACPGQPGPRNPKEEQLQPPVTEGRLHEDDGRQLVTCRRDPPAILSKRHQDGPETAWSPENCHVRMLSSL